MYEQKRKSSDFNEFQELRGIKNRVVHACTKKLQKLNFCSVCLYCLFIVYVATKARRTTEIRRR